MLCRARALACAFGLDPVHSRHPRQRVHFLTHHPSALNPPSPRLPPRPLARSPANPSPPFAGTSMMEQPEPSSLSLGEAIHPTRSSGSDPRTSPIAEIRSIPPPQGAEGDEETGRARSRRLVSGYRFGNPPSPVVVNHDLARSMGAVELAEEDGALLASERDTLVSDSPPLTEPEGEGDQSAVAIETLTLESFPEAEAEARHTSARRRSERHSNRGAAWGMDTLVGLNDGEADADDRAPKSEHPTQAYLRGEGGEEGRYRFPRHRLKARMKGESAQGRGATAPRRT